MNFLQYARGVLVQVETGLHIIPKQTNKTPQAVIADASPAISLPGAPVAAPVAAEGGEATATLPTMESSTTEAPADTGSTEAPADTGSSTEAPAESTEAPAESTDAK